MWRRRALTGAVLLTFLVLSPRSLAQMSSMNIFSPYTMYGIGDLTQGGNAFNRAMGGIEVGVRDGTRFNYLNPASLSAMNRKTALFNFSGIGQNIYSKTPSSSTTHNTFNIHDVGLAVPLGRAIGLGFSMTPVSSVGYTSQVIDDNPNIIEDIGSMTYEYLGEGGITQVTMSVGAQLFKGFSLGASMHYWFGNIERQYNAVAHSYLAPTDFRGIYSMDKLNISKLLFTIGAQYSFPVGRNRGITIGATFQPKVTASSRHKKEILSVSSTRADTVFSGNTREDIDMPMKIMGGLYYQSPKFTAGFDYSRQDWDGALQIPEGQNIMLGAQEIFKVGFSYTPNRYDIRSALKRWTYKIGARYGTSYLILNGQKLRDVAISLGADFALKKGSYSRFGFGVELGQRGSHTVKVGQVRERYFNFFASLSLFGDDYWFVRPKYN